MELSEDQKRVLGALLQWKETEKRKITLGGFAGTGKTTLIGIFRAELKKKYPKLRVAFCSYTGKATRVLKQSLQAAKVIEKNDSIGTIHSLIYSPILDKKENIIGWKLKEKVEADLIIVDEASMVDEKIWKNLMSFGIAIVAVGDHGQLPPINGAFNLMDRPELRLEEIHRQARGNPIIELSILARENGEIPIRDFGEGVRKINKNSLEAQEILEEELRNIDDETLLLCGYNFTRVKLNKFIRGVREFESEAPQPGDKVICLRNNHEKEIYNGMMGKIVEIEEDKDDFYRALISFDEEPFEYEGKIFKKQFNNQESFNFTQNRALVKESDLFDFGYALTVHKAQGSQANKVILFEERFAKMDENQFRRWLYTAVTRAKSELLIIG